jgi:hypothetical protein
MRHVTIDLSLIVTPTLAWLLLQVAGGWRAMTRRRRIGWALMSIFTFLPLDGWWGTLAVGMQMLGLAFFLWPGDDHQDGGSGGGRLRITNRVPAWRAHGVPAARPVPA